MRESLERSRGSRGGEEEGEGGGEDWEREMASLLESIDALSRLLMAALEHCR